MRTILMGAALAAGLARGAFAQTTAAPPPAPAEPAASAPAVAEGPCCHLASGAPVKLEFAEAISSRTQKPGDHFKVRLAEPLSVGDHVVVPAGTLGVGEVIDAAGGGLAGRPGKLILAVRYLDYGGQHVPLRGFKFGQTGQNNTTSAIVAGALIGIPGYLITGGNIDVPVGAKADAKLGADLTLPAADMAAPAAQAALTPSTTGPTQ